MSATAQHNVQLGAGVAPHAEARRFRRLVTGVNGAGKAVFLEDGETSSIQTVANTPTFVVTNLWQHTAVPVDNDGPVDDGLGGNVTLDPPLGGSVLRIVEFPPDREWKAQGVADQVHATPSLDYALVLEGEIWAVLDEEEKLMKPGEVLIQRGTRHAWSNRSDKQAVVAFVLIGGTIPAGH
ncbi:cupin domain-containing protein [Streptomyces sp. NPDC101455]|uniref:cupin domain-containing protein n=1 Tax=Streptomyces sp. NPDC101455 TaxID=3366142 RepID=UPI0037F521E9